MSEAKNGVMAFVLVVGAILACGGSDEAAVTPEGGGEGEADPTSACYDRCTNQHSSCIDGCLGAHMAEAFQSGDRSGYDACAASCGPQNDSCTAGCEQMASGGPPPEPAPAPDPAVAAAPVVQPDQIQAELQRQLALIQQAGEAGQAARAQAEAAAAAAQAQAAAARAQQSAATAGTTEQCIGYQQDCTYGGTPECCAPMPCLCAHGYCRCGTAPQPDNAGGGATPPQPTSQPCPKVDCVSMEAKHPRGPGHCDGKMTGWITNGCSEDVTCRYHVANSNRSSGMSNVPAGEKRGGDMGGIWTCGEPDDQTWQYFCTTKAAKDAGCTW
jgi:hypothetical protein